MTDWGPAMMAAASILSTLMSNRSNQDRGTTEQTQLPATWGEAYPTGSYPAAGGPQQEKDAYFRALFGIPPAGSQADPGADPGAVPDPGLLPDLVADPIAGEGGYSFDSEAGGGSMSEPIDYSTFEPGYAPTGKFGPDLEKTVGKLGELAEQAMNIGKDPNAGPISQFGGLVGQGLGVPVAGSIFGAALGSLGDKLYEREKAAPDRAARLAKERAKQHAAWQASRQVDQQVGSQPGLQFGPQAAPPQGPGFTPAGDLIGEFGGFPGEDDSHVDVGNTFGGFGGYGGEGYGGGGDLGEDVSEDEDVGPGGYQHGSWYTPAGEATLHEGEIVVPKPEADKIRAQKFRRNVLPSEAGPSPKFPNPFAPEPTPETGTPSMQQRMLTDMIFQSGIHRKATGLEGGGGYLGELEKVRKMMQQSPSGQIGGGTVSILPGTRKTNLANALMSLAENEMKIPLQYAEQFAPNAPYRQFIDQYLRPDYQQAESRRFQLPSSTSTSTYNPGMTTSMMNAAQIFGPFFKDVGWGGGSGGSGGGGGGSFNYNPTTGYV